ncbi:glycosyltransferase family 4 protein [Vibrio kyushuensis]|uniref:glycosyltransferase family 4 protein n=1 Tax=Vibrio kyushuensis TaxID=2910249 RepID=UPI003D13AB8C
MKIAMLVWNEFLNDARVLKEAQTLHNAGYQVCVHALYTPGKNKQQEALECGVNVKRVPRSPFWKLRKRNETVESSSTTTVKVKSLSTHRQLLRLIARSWTHLSLCKELVKSKPDVIHAHDVNVLPTAWLAAKICRVPLVYDAHEISTSREGYQAFRKVVGWVEKKLMPRASGTITTTDMRAKYLARAYGIARPIVLQNRPRRSVPTQKTDYLHSYLSLENDWPIILYQGGLQSGRGLDTFIRSAALVDNAYFVLIGGGRLTGELHELVKLLKLENQVHFISTVSLAELPLFTASADIGVQPIENTCMNHYTTDSNKLFEYALAGLPVIATDFPEIRKVVNGYQIGQLITEQTEQALAVELNDLIDHPEKRALYRSNTLEYRGKLCWEEQEYKLVELYQSILEGK